MSPSFQSDNPEAGNPVPGRLASEEVGRREKPEEPGEREVWQKVWGEGSAVCCESVAAVASAQQLTPPASS